MIALAILLILISAGVGVVLMHLFRLLDTPRNLAESLDAVAEFSAERYRPMIRLVDGSDQSFLKSHPLATPKMIVRLRKEHCRTFRAYLRSLETDFQAVCWTIKAIMLQSQTDRPDLASLLLRSQVAFAISLLKIELRVALYSCGIGTVSVAGLLNQFDGMRLELRNLTPAAMPSAA
ncbi:MAG TPA: hypothetical protein VLY24_18360 [Bryobacteraceae bacterium]|nr:hypothetical protein [Bryobacteraceae bacterium]